MRSSVVLPAPLRPAMVSRSRRSSLSETPLSSGAPEMSLRRSEAISTAMSNSAYERAGRIARVRRLQGFFCCRRESRMRIPRTRGAVSGVLLVVLGAWGALVPFIGPSFNLTIGPDSTFHMTSGRLWLSLVPGVVAALGGLMLLFSANRATAILGAQLGLAAGAWFVVGPTLSQLWSSAPGALGQAGYPAGDEGRRVLESIAYFYGVGAAIMGFAGLALGRLTLRSARDVELATAAAAPAPAAAATAPRTGRFDRPTVRDDDPVAEPAAVGAPAATTTRDEGFVRGPVDRAEERTAATTAAPSTTVRRRRGGLLGRFRS